MLGFRNVYPPLLNRSCPLQMNALHAPNNPQLLSEYNRVEVLYDVLLPWLAEVPASNPTATRSVPHPTLAVLSSFSLGPSQRPREKLPFI